MTSEVAADPAGDALVHVFRTVVDPFVGQVSVFKVLSGTVATGDRLVSTATGADDRVHGLFRLRGREHLAVDRVVAGDVAAVGKVSAASTGTLLAGRRMPVTARDLPPRPSVYTLALRPVSQSDDDKLSAALARLRAEDATLHVDLAGSQAVLGGLGDAHLAVAVERLERSFGVRVTTEPVQVAYRETIARAVEAEGRVKKQSGGHGQFAVVQLRVSPLARGEGFAFVSSVVGGSVPRQYLPAVERARRARRWRPAGRTASPSSTCASRSSTARRTPSTRPTWRSAPRAAWGARGARHGGDGRARARLRGDRDRPSRRAGRRHGRPLRAPWPHHRDRLLPDGRVRVDALVPEAELTRYVLDLRSITGGRGSFTAVPDRYEVLPGGVGASR